MNSTFMASVKSQREKHGTPGREHKCVHALIPNTQAEHDTGEDMREESESSVGTVFTIHEVLFNQTNEQASMQAELRTEGAHLNETLLA